MKTAGMCLALFALVAPRAAVANTDCNLNGVPDALEIAELDALDCNGDGFLDECDLDVLLRVVDCDGNERLDECDLQDPTRDIDGDDVLDTCEPTFSDCDRNGIHDLADLADGDCDGNGVPDRCDLVDQPFFERLVRAYPSPSIVATRVTTADVWGQGVASLVYGNVDAVTVAEPMLDLHRLEIRRYVFDVSVERIAVADFDADGSNDLAVVSRRGVSLHFNDFAGGFASAGEIVDDGWELGDVVAADFDGDGAGDLFIAISLPSGGVIYHGSGFGLARDSRRIDVPGGFTDLHALDIDGDGDNDIVGRTARRVWFLDNLGGRRGFDPVLAEEFEEREEIVALDVSDIDGDGAPELVMATYDVLASGRSPTIVTISSLANGFAERVARRRLPHMFPLGIEAVDLDGDGLRDVVLTGVVATRNTEDVLLVREARAPESGLVLEIFSRRELDTRKSLDSADIDGDGRDDLVAVNERDEVEVSLVREPFTARDENADGRPDRCDMERRPFIRGDFDINGRVNLSDSIATLEALFRAGPWPPCERALDVDLNGRLGVTDPVAILNHLFLAAPRLAPPFPSCGESPVATTLSCERSGCE